MKRWTIAGLLLGGSAHAAPNEARRCDARLAPTIAAGIPDTSDVVLLYSTIDGADPPRQVDLQALAQALGPQIGNRPIWLADGAPAEGRARFRKQGPQQVAFIEQGELTIEEISIAIHAHQPPTSLVIFATTAPVQPVLDTLGGSLVVLPCQYQLDVPMVDHAIGQGRLIAPWVDGRFEIGVLSIDLDNLGFDAQVVACPSDAEG